MGLQTTWQDTGIQSADQVPEASVQRIIRLCDLHDGEEVAAVETVAVSLGRRAVLLDVCASHLAVLADLPPATGRAPAQAQPDADGQPSTAAPRRPARQRVPRHPAGQGTPAAQPASRRQLQRERALVREWARQSGRDVGDKGRLPTGLVEEYRRTTSSTS